MRRSVFLAALLGIVWLLSTVMPAKALYCEEEMQQTCNLIFGTQCQITHEDPCHP